MEVLSAGQIAGTHKFFKIFSTTDRTQIAVMNLGEGQTSGEFGTDHPQADQILVVLEGGGSVKVGDEERALSKGDVVLVPAGAPHQVRGPNKTLSVYGPPAYDEDEEG